MPKQQLKLTQVGAEAEAEALLATRRQSVSQFSVIGLASNSWRLRAVGNGPTKLDPRLPQNV